MVVVMTWDIARQLALNGRCMPSTIFPIKPMCVMRRDDSYSSFDCTPGPNSTDSGFPVLRTGSPTVTPDVSSYTWMVALSASNRMTSVAGIRADQCAHRIYVSGSPPTSSSCPTRTSSNIAAPVMFSAITTGPDTPKTCPKRDSRSSFAIFGRSRFAFSSAPAMVVGLTRRTIWDRLTRGLKLSQSAESRPPAMTRSSQLDLILHDAT